VPQCRERSIPTGHPSSINEGPDGPSRRGEPVANFAPADPKTTGQVMKFQVGPLDATDAGDGGSAGTKPVRAVAAASVLATAVIGGAVLTRRYRADRPQSAAR
jgi:bilirubin oxidase